MPPEGKLIRRVTDGSDFNFKFDLTESELLFFNSKSKKDVYERLDCCFTKLNCEGGNNY